MDIESIFPSRHSRKESRIGFLGVFVSPAVESAFREQHFRDDLWLSIFLVTAGMLRVALVLVADYQYFGGSSTFWLLFAARLLFLLLSAGTLLALRRAASCVAAERILCGWGLLIITMTVCAISARSSSDNRLLLMSFSMIIGIYCVAPLPLSRQAAFALTYSAAALYTSRQADGATLLTVGTTYALAHFFGVVASWRLNHRRREMFLGALREAELRTCLEAALAEIKTLKGMLCICAWCKRIRDEAEGWESVENYVQNRTHASFSHGICPDCLRSQASEVFLP